MKQRKWKKQGLAALLALAMVPWGAAAAVDGKTAELAPVSQEYLDYLELSPEEQAKTNMPLPFEVNLPDDEGMNQYNKAFPSSYDGRTKGYLGNVKNQGETGTCWTMAATSNLEAYLNRTMPQSSGTSYEFSPRHMEFSNVIFPNDVQNPDALYRAADMGGNQMISSAYYTRGAGPVDNTGSMKFFSYPHNNVQYPKRADLMIDPDFQVTDYQFIWGITGNTWAQVEQSRLSKINEIKQSVLDNGSVDLGIYAGSNAYLSSNNAYYNPNKVMTTNHEVLVVGWDDNYPRENFNASARPQKDGAWIVQNSWGSNILDQGFYYVSYEEYSCYQFNGAIAGAERKDYDNGYVLDPAGFNGLLNIGTGAYAANVFDKEPGTEWLTGVNIATMEDCNYAVYVTDGSLNIRGKSPVATGYADFSGYHQVDFSSPVALRGNQFAVVVLYEYSYYGQIPVESKIAGSAYNNVSAPAGSSYYSFNGTSWKEISTSSSKYSNFCIKAFTKQGSDQADVTFTLANDREVIDLYRTSDGDRVRPHADGSYILAKNTTYCYVIQEYTSQTQSDGSHIKKTTGNIKTSGSSTQVIDPRNVEEPLPFWDVQDGAWFYDDVKYCYEHKIMTGIDGGAFGPNNSTNRAMVVTVLWRLAGEPQATTEVSFGDVNKNAWYYDAVQWAASKGVVNGVENGNFAPERNISRQDFAAMLYRYEKIQNGAPSIKGDLSSFADGGKVADYAQDAMGWCVGEGILNGRDGNLLAPTGSIVRSEMAAMLHRYLT